MGYVADASVLLKEKSEGKIIRAIIDPRPTRHKVDEAA